MANELILDVDWNITKAEAKQREMNRKLDESQLKVENTKKKIDELNSALDEERAKQEEIKDEVRAQVEEMKKLEAQVEKVKNGTATVEEIVDLGSLDAAENKLSEMQAAIEKNNVAFDKSLSSSQKIESEISKQNYELEKQKNKTAEIGDKILLNSKKQNKFTQAFQKSQKSADRFGKRLKSLIASALFFSVVTKAFTALRNEFGKLINQTGTKSAALVSQLNGNLSVLGRTLYESARPAIEWLLDKLVKITNIITHGIAKMLGKSVDEMRKLAKATAEVRNEAKKTTASFDTLQTLGDSSSTTKAADFDAITGEIDNETSYLMMILSGALLVLGVILTFTGVNIPLGLGLIAAGAVGLAASLSANWNTMSQKTQETITGIMGIGGGLFMLLGLILILTGAGIPLGIGLILMGAGLLYGAQKLTPGDDFVEKVKNLWKNVKNVTKNFIDWFSNNVLDGIFGKEFGDTLDDLFEDISLFWKSVTDLFDGMANADDGKVGTSLLNSIIAIANILIDAINLVLNIVHWVGSQILALLGELVGKGKETWEFFRGNGYQWNIPRIPYRAPKLATGAVLPGGSPMLAWVNDQPKGQPYVEGSIENIAAAFEKYLGDRSFGSNNLTLNVTGNMAQLMRFLTMKITEEQNRASVF